MRARDVIALLQEMMPCDPSLVKVDGLVLGDELAPVSRIGVAFVASVPVLEAAREAGVDFLITHEGAFFRHEGDVAGEDPVLSQKRSLLRRLGISVYRLHDRPHRASPDWVAEGLAEALGWSGAIRERMAEPCDVPIVAWAQAMTFDDVVARVCARLGVRGLRVSGRVPVARRIALLPGYRGTGDLVARVFRESNADVILAGEGPEWEAMEYVRDACAMGLPRAVVWLGHQLSESPGMRRIAKELAAHCRVPVVFLDQESAFAWQDGTSQSSATARQDT
ncbi:Putative GTP cyclohydrolase 1 type 2, NIF3 family [Alicyclobacillus vulcanalis]|uniref:GTP cyclohydrolase 1 type 2 homolog n=2 Tax=Alicyclobacillus vulcanalis TaxID=252246 RepID=A0A1N7KVT9_9BACL|nr:Putative GTP cyclohydrolase 1 type 2, NIF3 family [Alicyclobacillus vulcanalis]